MGPDPINGAKSVRNLYEKANDTHGKYTVPVLWDKKTGTIVSNESSEIIRMFNSAFQDFAEGPMKDWDFYPGHLRTKIDEANEWIYPQINNGVYMCGFAKTQAAYDEAIDILTQGLDRLEALLSSQRYVAGDILTEADLRLFMTLVRYDEVYVVYFKTNTRRIVDSENILNYCREIYQIPGMKETINMEHIKIHYFTSHPQLNHYAIIPRGNDFLGSLAMPHNRNSIPASP